MTEESELVGAIYDAALDATEWPAVLRRFCTAAGVGAAGLKWEVAGGMEQTWHGLPEPFERAFVEHYWRMDPWTLGTRQQPPGRVFLSHEMIPDEALLKGEFYNDLCVPHGLKDAIGGCLLHDDDLYVTFGMMRWRDAPGSGEREARQARALFPHLQRAVVLQQWLAGLDRSGRAFEHIVANLRIGVLIVDRHCRILYANAAAERLLRSADSLISHQGTLATHTRSTTALLRAAVAYPAGPPNALRLPRGPGRLPLGVLVTPPHRVAALAPPATQPAAVVYVADGDREGLPAAALLRTIFGLTAAETRLALLLVGGRTVAEAAKFLHVNDSTARTQLRQLLTKTAAHDEGALLQMLASLTGLPG